VSAAAAPAKILILPNRFLIGGQERQTILHLATMDRAAWQPVVACLKLEGEHLQDLERLGLRAQALGVQKMASPTLLWHAARLAARLRAEGIAVLHTQDFFSGLIGALAAQLARTPIIVTRVDLAHALDVVRRGVLAAMSRAATRVLVNAVCIRDRCVQDGVAPERVAVVRNGLDLARFDGDAARDPAPGAPDPARPWVVQVANMHHPVKGQADVLAAMRYVAREVPAAELVLVGDGVRRPLLERLARDLGIAGRCRFLGARRDVPALLARAAVVVSASHSEGISNAILEAMAARRPVVATAVGGTPEVVRHAETGFLVAPGAPAQIAFRVAELLRDRELSRRMGEAGRSVVAREFGVEQMRRSYDALYRGILAERGQPAPSASAPEESPARRVGVVAAAP
jgi:glycosyltransferase involved in cell wall biosynthesis